MPILFPTSPTVGQVFTSGGRSWVWSGATWDSPTATNTLLAPYGLEFIATATNTNTTGVIMSNVFSSKYSNYRIVVDGFGSVNSQRLLARLRSGATDLTTNYFCGTAAVDQTTTSTTIYRTTASDAIDLSYVSNNSNAQTSFSFDLSNPFTTLRKSYHGTMAGFNGGIVNYMGFMGGLVGDNISRDGINLYSPSNWTGTVRVYGYRNA
jgi:hypothetical protein